MLYREPKLLKARKLMDYVLHKVVSVLYREPKLLKERLSSDLCSPCVPVSVLYREPKLLKVLVDARAFYGFRVSVLYREPKLLKETARPHAHLFSSRFQCSTVSRNC